MTASNADNPKRFASAKDAGRRVARPRPEFSDQQALRADTIRVLSYIPLHRCGATVESLAHDAFPGAVDGEDLVNLCLIYAVSRLNVSIRKAPQPDGGKMEYWIDNPLSRRQVAKLVSKLVEAELEK